jgi:hypothetical protein
MAIAGLCTFVHLVHTSGYADHMQFLIALFIACEFGCYVAIRQVVNAKEWLMACQFGTLSTKSCELSLKRFSIGRGRKGLLRKRLRASQTYQVGLRHMGALLR